MLQFLTIHNGKYVLYDTCNHSFDYYGVIQLKRLIEQKTIQGLSLINDRFEVQFGDNNTNLTRDLGDIKYLDGTVCPTFIIRRPIQIPKLPVHTILYYKGIFVSVNSSSVVLSSKKNGPNNQKGKTLFIRHIQDCPTIHNYAKKELMGYQVDYSLDEYNKVVQELFSCLTYDSTVLSYNVCIYSGGNLLDLTMFPKTVKINRYNITVNYLLYITNKNLLRINYDGLYLKVNNVFTDKIKPLTRTVLLFDCTKFKSKYWRSTGLRASFYSLLFTTLHNYGVVVFRRSIAMVKDVQALLDTKDDINVINLGNFNGGGELEPVLEDIRKKQSKYALMSNPVDTKLTILLANII